MMKPIRIAIADDHELFRQGLCSLLRLESAVEVVAEVDRVSEIGPMLEAAVPDVLLLDLQMDRWSLGDIEKLSRQVGVLVLTASERMEDALAAIRQGARAVVQKRLAVETLMDAVRAVAAGGVWMPPELQAQLAARWIESPGARLTVRESEVVRLVAGGLRNSEVAKKLFISEVTVKTHLNNVFQKLGIRDRVELTLYAVREGLVSIDRVSDVGPSGR